MGVQGLWSILYSTGRDIDLSSLEGKVLAIDLSIWLNQALKSGIDSPNVHLEILFRRICKLLFYKIKPVFVFDGPSPSLKQETILLRRKQRQLKHEKSELIRSNIINLLMKKKITEKRKPQDDNFEESVNIFKLPENDYLDNLVDTNNDCGFSDVADDYLNNFPSTNEIDFESDSFLSMPLEVQHEIIRNIAKEKRYGYDTNQSNFCQKSGSDFSSLQIQRLLNRNSLQQKVENLRTCMDYRNNENMISSLQDKQMRNLSANNVRSRKILSHNDGYLMMIDPSENDIVDSLTKLKKETMLKKLNQHKTENKTNEFNMDKLNNKESNEEICNNKAYQNENRINLNVPLVMLSKENEETMYNNNPSVLDHNKIGNCNSIITHSIIKKQDIDQFGSTINLSGNLTLSENEKISENETFFDEENKIIKQETIFENKKIYNLENQVESETISENKEIFKNKNIFDKEISPNEQITNSEIISETDKILEKKEIFDIELISKNETISEREKKSKNENISLNKEITEIENQQNNVDSIEDYNEESIMNETDSQSLDDSDDDFVDVPEIEEEIVEEIQVDDETKEIANEVFSQSDIEMIMTDPIKWQEDIGEKIDNLYKEERKIENQAASMSERYYQEAKELLKLFGIPYLESPGEAEAQCAFLEKCNLTDGTITEDSDVWLFGGRMVYKHVFSRDWSIRAYSHNHINKKLGLTRDLMICIALLSGSDYTTGIYGIGPVIAMEILAEFSDPDVEQSHFEVLQNFKEWHNKWFLSDKPYSGNIDKKRFLRFQLHKNFPDARIFDAYNAPLVDESIEPFIWSKPCIDKLLEFAQTKMGWEHLKILDMLNLAIGSNKSNSKLCQKSILDYFKDSVVDELLNSKKAPSKRLKLATKHRNSIVQKVKK